MMKKNARADTRSGGSESSRRFLVKCKDCEGDLWLHNCKKPCEREIFNIPEFANMSCFEIYHSEHAKGLWDYSMKDGVRRNKRNPSHPVFKQIREMNGLSPTIQRTRRGRANNTLEEQKDETQGNE